MSPCLLEDLLKVNDRFLVSGLLLPVKRQVSLSDSLPNSTHPDADPEGTNA